MTDANEAKVRAAWSVPIVIRQADEYGWLNLWKLSDVTKDSTMYSTESSAWAAAAEFTASRQQQIADVDEEIDVIQRILSSYVSHGGATFKRILTRLQAARAELTRGMVTPQPKESQ